MADEAASGTGTTQLPEARNLLKAPEDQKAGPHGLTAAEEAKLIELQAKAVTSSAGGSTMDLRITSGHSEMHYGGVRLTSNWTTVPRHMAGPLETAAADSGVTIESREQEG